MKMKMARIAFVSLVLAGLVTQPALAADYYAATNGAGTPGTSWASAFTNLQAALNAATSSGDVIYLAGHTFAHTNTLRWTNSGVTLRGGYAGVGAPGSNNPSLWPTVIKPGIFSTNLRALLITNVTAGTLEQVTFTGVETWWPPMLSGGGINLRNSTFTIAACIFTQNRPSADEVDGQGPGGGIRAVNCSVTIINCVISNNTVGSSWGTIGGGVYLLNSSAVLTGCTITSNTAVSNGNPNDGGGVYGDNSTVAISNCVLTANYLVRAGSSGGGVYMNGGRLTMVNSLVIANFSAGRGGGMLFNGGTNRLQNCTIVTNIGDGVSSTNAAVVMLKDSIVWENGDDLAGFPTNAFGVLTNVFYSNISNGDNAGTNGCISSDPLFVDNVYYHLKSRGQRYAGGYFSGGSWTNDTVSSPSIDTGDPASDYSREPVPNGHRVNMGAYGNSAVASQPLIFKGSIFSFQ